MHFYFHSNFPVKYHGINARTGAKMMFVWNCFHDSWLLISFINIPLHQLWRGCDVFSSKHIFTLSSFLISISFASTRLLSYLSEAGVRAEAWGKILLEKNTCFFDNPDLSRDLKLVLDPLELEADPGDVLWQLPVLLVTLLIQLYNKVLIKIPIQLQVIHLFVVNNILRNGRPDLLLSAICELLKGGA